MNSLDKLKKITEEKKKKEEENISIYQKLITMRKEVENLMDSRTNYLNSTKSITSKNNLKTSFGKYINSDKKNNKLELNDCSMIVNNTINNTLNNINDNSGLIEEKDLQEEEDDYGYNDNFEAIIEEDDSSDNKTEIR